MPALTAVVVFDEVLYRPGGQVHRWMTLLTSHFEHHAKDAAPERSGDLRAGIRSRAIPFGTRQMQGTIASNAPHSMWVLRGTTGPIYSDAAWAVKGDFDAAFAYQWVYVTPEGKMSRSPTKGSHREFRAIRQKGHWLAVGKQRLWPPISIMHSVSGQKANNFLFAAWRATARTHPALRGLSPTASITDF